MVTHAKMVKDGTRSISDAARRSSDAAFHRYDAVRRRAASIRFALFREATARLLHPDTAMTRQCVSEFHGCMHNAISVMPHGLRSSVWRMLLEVRSVFETSAPLWTCEGVPLCEVWSVYSALCSRARTLVRMIDLFKSYTEDEDDTAFHAEVTGAMRRVSAMMEARAARARDAAIGVLAKRDLVLFVVVEWRDARARAEAASS